MAALSGSAVVTLDLVGGGKRTYQLSLDGSEEEIKQHVETYAHRQANLFKDQQRLLRWKIMVEGKYTDVGYVPLPAEPFGEEK